MSPGINIVLSTSVNGKCISLIVPSLYVSFEMSDYFTEGKMPFSEGKTGCVSDSFLL